MLQQVTPNWLFMQSDDGSLLLYHRVVRGPQTETKLVQQWPVPSEAGVTSTVSSGGHAEFCTEQVHACRSNLPDYAFDEEMRGCDGSRHVQLEFDVNYRHQDDLEVLPDEPATMHIDMKESELASMDIVPAMVYFCDRDGNPLSHNI